MLQHVEAGNQIVIAGAWRIDLQVDQRRRVPAAGHPAADEIQQTPCDVGRMDLAPDRRQGHAAGPDARAEIEHAFEAEPLREERRERISERRIAVGAAAVPVGKLVRLDHLIAVEGLHLIVVVRVDVLPEPELFQLRLPVGHFLEDQRHRLSCEGRQIRCDPFRHPDARGIDHLSPELKQPWPGKQQLWIHVPDVQKCAVRWRRRRRRIAVRQSKNWRRSRRKKEKRRCEADGRSGSIDSGLSPGESGSRR